MPPITRGGYYVDSGPGPAPKAKQEETPEARFERGKARYFKRLADNLRAGFRIEPGQPDLLQIDVDDAERLEDARELLGKFGKRFGVVSVEQTTSKSGNWHLHVKLMAPLAREERVLLQGLLGGDPVRAMLDWLWVKEGHPEECFFVETAHAKRKPFDYEDLDLPPQYR